jgi:thioredoxin-related protein
MWIRIPIAQVTLLTLATGFVLAAAVVSDDQPVTADKAKRIHFENLPEALRQGSASDRRTIVFFTADWCGWCRKMRSTTFTDPQVQAVAGQFTWAKVDVDEEPALAAQYQVQGLPMLVLVDSRGNTIASRAGYLTSTALLRWLNDPEAQADRAAPRRSASMLPIRLPEIGTGAPAEQAVVKLIATIAQGQRSERDRVRQHLRASGARAWPGLVAALADPHLAVRAAAYDMLRASNEAGPAFDPFATSATRAEQLQAWQRYLEQIARP